MESENFLEIFDGFDKYNAEERRLSLRALEDFYGSVITKEGK